jgi:DNA polymerase IV
VFYPEQISTELSLIETQKIGRFWRCGVSKTILHIDINSYFATILQQENPYLRGKPIGVVKDVGRTCLIAASKEAKQKGVLTGERKKYALLKCPDLITVPATFERYLDTTKRLQKLFTAIAPSVIIYSLDEAFIDISNCRKILYPDSQVLAQKIQALIKAELGSWVTCNIGIAQNKLLAKMASEVAPKGTVSEITDENKDALLATTPFSDVCGVGYRLAQKLQQLNVYYPYQIRFIPEEELIRLVGPFWAKELIKIAFGEETHLLDLTNKPIAHMKSVGRSVTGYRLYDDATEIKNIIINLCLEVIHKIRKMKLSGRQVWLGLYGQELSWSKHSTFQTPLDTNAEVIEKITELYSFWGDTFKVIKFAVRVSLLSPKIQDQLLPSWQKNEAVQSALDSINEKYGMFSIHPAAVPPTKDLIYPEVTGFLGDKIFQLQE